MSLSALLCVESPFTNLSSSRDPVLFKDRVLLQMLQTEELLAVNPSYLENTQAGCLTQDMRREVVIWMAMVCEHHGCSVHIFPLAVNFLDRMLSYVRIRHEDLQLTAAACLLIASKLMQAQPFSIAKLKRMTAATAKKLTDTELFVLSKLKWDLCAITPFDFLDYFLEQLDVSKRQRKAIFLTVRRLVYLSCKEYRFIMYPPSLIATGAICVAAKLLHLQDLQHRNNSLLHFLHRATGIDEDFIETCRDQMYELLDEAA